MTISPLSVADFLIFTFVSKISINFDCTLLYATGKDGSFFSAFLTLEEDNKRTNSSVFRTDKPLEFTSYKTYNCLSTSGTEIIARACPIDKTLSRNAF